MPITIDTIKSEGRLVAENERYTIHDYDLDDLTVSLTQLKKGKETRGHSHDSNAEVYFFPYGGDAAMAVGNEKFNVDHGAVLIPGGEFHRVVNKSKKSDLLFVSIFAGKRNESKAKYADTARADSHTNPVAARP
jgi:mannose-6-phosphate isomerase-like protein (cupin superfamily)